MSTATTLQAGTPSRFTEVNMNFLKVLTAHWKTSTAGIAAALLIVLQSYHNGMTWKQWGAAAAVALLGLTAHDADATPPDVTPPAAKP